MKAMSEVAVSAASAVAFCVFCLQAVADSPVTLSGAYTADYEYTATSDTTINLSGVTFTDCSLKLKSNPDTASYTFTINLVDGTQNIFNNSNQAKECIKATKKSNLVIAGGGTLELEGKKRTTDGGKRSGLVVCNNLTVAGGDTTVTFNNNKNDTSCIFIKGDYLQTGGKMKVDLKKKNCTNELHGVTLDTKDTSFTLRAGTFSAEIGGTKSRAIDLKKSGTALFEGGKVKVEFEGPDGRFVNGGNIYIEGGEFNLTTNITAKLEADFHPTGLSAFKPDDSIYISGGDIEAELPLADSEVIDAGTNVVISAGALDLTAGNDCIHASEYITISGGRVWAVSVGDDALDANKGIRISGGDIRAYATAEGAHGLDVNKGDKLVISGGTVVATDGLDAIRIGSGDPEVGKVEFIQPTYYGTLATTGYSGKYLYLEGETNGVAFVVKPCLPAFPAGRNFNLLASVPGRNASVPEAKSAAEAYSDRSSRNPMVFEKKASVSGHTITTKDGSAIEVPAYYDLSPDSGKTKTVTLSLNALATPQFSDEEDDGIAAISLHGDTVQVGVRTLAGLNYILRGSGELAVDAAWADIGEAVVGDGTAKALSAPSGTGGFFKVASFD